MRMIGRGLGVMAATIGLGLTMPVAAQDDSAEAQTETRIGEEGFVSPPATLDQMDWLIGQWAGEGIGGAPAMESWLPPTGGTMVGTFVQEREDEDGPTKIMFTEHMYLSEADGTLVLKLKHFNADLTGWEEKDDMLTFRLVAIEECAAYFNALTLRCADKDRPGEGLVAAVRMKSGGELKFTCDRSAPPQPRSTVCANAFTTVDMNECLAGLMAKADERRVRYLNAALERHKDRPELTAKISTADAAFTAYRDSECGAVYENWKEGTIRGIMSLTCRTDMTDKRTKTVWENWLTYADSTPPVLPEPKPTM